MTPAARSRSIRPGARSLPATPETPSPSPASIRRATSIARSTATASPPRRSAPSAQGQAVTVIPSGPNAGKIVVGGFFFNGAANLDFVLTRFSTNGSLDTTFGTAGRTVTNFAGTSADQVFAIGLQPSGGDFKLIAVGSSGGNFALARYNSNGSIDTTFGAAGKVTTDIGGGTEDQAASVAIDAAGNIVVVGTSDDDLAVARYTAAGALDTSFNGSGKLKLDLNSGSVDVGSGVAIDAAGRIITSATSDGDFAVAIFTSAGLPDNTFSADGKAFAGQTGTVTSGVVVQPYDNRIVAVGTAADNFTLVRFNGDGTLDSNFGTGGVLTTDMGGIDSAAAIAYTGTPTTRRLVVAGSSDGDFAAARYDANIDPQIAYNAYSTAGNPLLVGAGGSRLLSTPSVLGASDADNTAAQLLFTVTATPLGTVQLNGVNTTTFTQAALAANTVTFKSNGTTGTGSFTFTVADGFGGVTPVATVYLSVVQPTTTYADDNFTPAPGGDLAPAGLSNGDTVAFPGAGNHTFGVDAFATIQEAINAVAAGGTVTAAGGTYVEDVMLNKAGVSLLGVSGAYPTIKGTYGDTTKDTLFVAADNTVVKGFTITRDFTVANFYDESATGLNNQGVTFAQGLSNSTFQNNIVTGNRNGLNVNNSQGVKILNNSITDNRTGIQFNNNFSGADVEQNYITNNWTLGILFGNNSPQLPSTGVVVTNNDISGNWFGGINRRYSTATVLNASGNWFGTTTPAYLVGNSTEAGYAASPIPASQGGIATNPGGAPDVIEASAGFLDFSPYLQTGTDTDPAAPGFQGSFVTLNTTPQGGQSQAFGRVQEASNFDPSTTTVNVRDSGSGDLRRDQRHHQGRHHHQGPAQPDVDLHRRRGQSAAGDRRRPQRDRSRHHVPTHARQRHHRRLRERPERLRRTCFVG